MRIIREANRLRDESKDTPSIIAILRSRPTEDWMQWIKEGNGASALLHEVDNNRNRYTPPVVNTGPTNPSPLKQAQLSSSVNADIRWGKKHSFEGTYFYDAYVDEDLKILEYWVRRTGAQVDGAKHRDKVIKQFLEDKLANVPVDKALAKLRKAW